MFLLYILQGALCALFAKNRGRSPLKWFIFGTLFPLFALLALLILPPLSIQRQTQRTTPKPSPPLGTPTPVSSTPLSAKVPYQKQFQEHQWYYLDRFHKKFGPINYSTLRKLWNDRALIETSYIWHDGLTDWKKIEEIPELYGELSLAD